MARLPAGRGHGHGGGRRHVGAEIGAGLRYALGTPKIRTTLALFGIVGLLGFNWTVAVPLLAVSLGAGPTGFGWLITVWGGGSVLGSLLGRKLTRRTEPMWLVLGAGGIALGHLGVGLAPVFWVVLVFGLFMGTSDGLTIVAETGIMQRRTPDAVRSRVMAGFLLGGIAAAIATFMLLPLWRLGRETDTLSEPERPISPVTDTG